MRYTRRKREGYLTTDDVARVLGVTPRTVWRWIVGARLPAEQVIRRWWIRVEDARRLAVSRRDGARAAELYAKSLVEVHDGMLGLAATPRELPESFPTPVTRPRPRLVPGPDFEAFWRAYPRRVGKGAAARAWLAIQPDEALLGRMLEALEWQRGQAQWLKDGGAFVPHPATWLNQCRWEDEPVDFPHLSSLEVASARAVEEALARRAQRKEIP